MGSGLGLEEAKGRRAQGSVLSQGEGAFGVNPGAGWQPHTLVCGMGEIGFPWGFRKVGDVAHMGFARLMTSHTVHLHIYRDLEICAFYPFSSRKGFKQMHNEVSPEDKLRRKILV